jgi:hypothetical protein
MSATLSLSADPVAELFAALLNMFRRHRRRGR